jgi:hypothetical protein
MKKDLTNDARGIFLGIVLEFNDAIEEFSSVHHFHDKIHFMLIFVDLTEAH